MVFLFVFSSVFFFSFVNKVTLRPSEGFIKFSIASASLSYFPDDIPKNLPSKSALILKSSLPSLSFDNKKEAPLKENPKKITESPAPVPPGIQEITIKEGGTSLFGIEINNETDLNLESAYTPKDIKENSSILIVHTHTSESYRPTEKYFYEPRDNQRTEDLNFNVAKVGSHLYENLISRKIEATHDNTINDYPSYNGSYSKTLKLIESHIEKNPSINIVLDLHRDAMIKSDGTALSTVCRIDGKKAAQIMIVVGTDRGGLPHSNWRSNFSFAVELQKALENKYPGLMRPLNVRCERFNGHASENEIIIEIGTTGNTLEEALLSAEALADGLSYIIKDS